MCGGTKWIIRSNRTGKSRSGAGAPIAKGLKNCRGSFIAKLSVDFWPGGTLSGCRQDRCQNNEQQETKEMGWT
jgi:hypothetical protein